MIALETQTEDQRTTKNARKRKDRKQRNDERVRRRKEHEMPAMLSVPKIKKSANQRDAEYARMQPKRDAKQDARNAERACRQEERYFIEHFQDPGVVLSEEEEAWWAPLKVARNRKKDQQNKRFRENYHIEINEMSAIGFSNSYPTAKNYHAEEA